MTVVVYRWDVTHRDTGVYTEAVVRDDPTVNATVSHRIGGDVRELIVAAWTRKHPDVTWSVDDFVFELPPPGWVNPNDDRS